ncbi:hypothetical protein CspeluHIS016_0108810 [Cutaneotrichosporon spelunceum]|uniref:Uncharacterized protein n=1 Tax=Cutaneotrichosporon spelunceum TaxID=1672016 RepID=A0AAD3TQ31_9TREE|nr:hypothetical protein CspeluHIS016_0108810 [Cutaneotrichosporon spelunceum]
MSLPSGDKTPNLSSQLARQESNNGACACPGLNIAARGKNLTPLEPNAYPAPQMPVPADAVAYGEMMQHLVLSNPAATETQKSNAQTYCTIITAVDQSVKGKRGDPGLNTIYLALGRKLDLNLATLCRRDATDPAYGSDMAHVHNIRTLNAANYQLSMKLYAIINPLTLLSAKFPRMFHVKDLGNLDIRLLQLYIVYLQFYLRPPFAPHPNLEPLFASSAAKHVRFIRALLGVPPAGVSSFH